ncbi:helix-turn-helix domain-containing protein [Candidatus Phyllobacterium onerii]|uniref:helix-turn-helix domain-containing protein n=1 Tax=Candidatus Phyllobacterium onerii TaxID=3020828 RepID=UPI002FEDEDE0
MISPEQCRAARALLNWTQDELAQRVSIAAASIRAFEKGREMRGSNQKLLRMTFEKAGIEFLDENGKGAGARLAKPSSWEAVQP